MPRHDIVYEIEMYLPSKHIGGTRHAARFSGGFWRIDGKLIALHKDVMSWTNREEGTEVQ